ncbi:Nmad3 family putative nucleotide modification protein [Halomicrobium katesii]|uniref:Nmad3 family putative nucleotide modification protein n=1 Tax=Halomicrobium katesii TaxID=437163 RepID=UPI00035ECBF2|nr:hypothetical protein [Halomicrobium katesii]
MTVVFAGVGADDSNVNAHAPLYPDGRFEYVPIPEKTPDTDESETYGSWALRYDDRIAAELTDRLDTYPEDGSAETVRDEAVADWPLHRDPNFEAMTYGEHREGFGQYVSRLSGLGEDDVVAFYTSLVEERSERKHRYLVGYFTVEGRTVIEPGDPTDLKREKLARHPENAHAKRAVEGVPFYDDKRLVLLDGRTPGGLFERDPIRLSEYRDRPDGSGGYYLDSAVAERFAVSEGSDYMTRKPALVSELDGEEFVERVGRPGDR